MTLKIPPGIAVSAVIPAAGFSSRMHHYKPVLRLGDKTMIEVVIQLFKSCGITDVIVVTGHNRDILTPVIRKASAKPVFNPDFETGMFSSIQKGVEHVSHKSAGFFLLPADIPAIRPSTIKDLALAFEKAPENIIIPEFEKTPGHPPLIPAGLIQQIAGMDIDANLGSLLLSREERLDRRPVYDRGILLDADTKEAYKIVSRKYQQMDIPDEKECHAIISQLLCREPAIQAHLALVAETALKLARAVEKGWKNNNKQTPDNRLNMHLIRAAALLHDIKRKEKNHAQAGSRFLMTLGFSRVAGIVAEHMTIKPGDSLTEKEIVYFADKLCIGSRVELDYSMRFAEKIKQVPEARTRILQRYEVSQQIQSRIEAAAGRSVRAILN